MGISKLTRSKKTGPRPQPAFVPNFGADVGQQIGELPGNPLAMPEGGTSALGLNPYAALLGIGVQAAAMPAKRALERRNKRIGKTQKQELGAQRLELLGQSGQAQTEALEAATRQRGDLQADFMRPQSYINQGVDRNQLDLDRRMGSISRYRARGLKRLEDQAKIARHQKKAAKLQSTLNMVSGFLGGGIGALG